MGQDLKPDTGGLGHCGKTVERNCSPENLLGPAFCGWGHISEAAAKIIFCQMAAQFPIWPLDVLRYSSCDWQKSGLSALRQIREGVSAEVLLEALREIRAFSRGIIRLPVSCNRMGQIVHFSWDVCLRRRTTSTKYFSLVHWFF
jgi:hypothetical protein